VARLLTGALPRVEVVCFEQLGHMGPVTHPEIVNVTICSFLDKLAPLDRAARPLLGSGGGGGMGGDANSSEASSGTSHATSGDESSGTDTATRLSAAAMRAAGYASLLEPGSAPPQAHPWPQVTAQARSQPGSQPTPRPALAKPQGWPSAPPRNGGHAVMNSGREVGPANPQQPTMQLP
jgi:hypothetical protein